MTGAFRSALAAVLVAVALVGASGCSTTYQPKNTGRVGLVVRYAGALYVKNGRVVPVGPFNGDLEGLVAETPPAATFARKAHRQFMIGIPAYLTGAACVIVGIVILSGPVGWIVIGTGASSMGTGLGFMGAGFTNAVDAIHIHNDAVSAAPPSAP